LPEADRTCGTPCIVISCFSNFGLCFRIIHYDIGPTNAVFHCNVFSHVQMWRVQNHKLSVIKERHVITLYYTCHITNYSVIIPAKKPIKPCNIYRAYMLHTWNKMYHIYLRSQLAFTGRSRKDYNDDLSIINVTLFMKNN